MLKKNNLWRIIWIVGIYGVLVLILYLIISYKVKWENLDLNKYLYFYDCSHQLCTSSVSQEKFYGRLMCADDTCPFIKEKKDNILIMSKDNVEFLYDYMDDKIINNNYVSYRFVTNNNYIVQREDGRQGVIDSTGTTLTDFNYSYIKDYKSGYFSAMENNKFKIINKDKDIDTGYLFDDVVLINDNIYAYSDDNKTTYQIASYSTNKSVNNIKYDYIYALDNLILVFYNKSIDIYDENLKSKLLMPIRTFYTYQEEKVRASLDFNISNSVLSFTVFNNSNTYMIYRYDLKNNKLL